MIHKSMLFLNCTRTDSFDDEPFAKSLHLLLQERLYSITENSELKVIQRLLMNLISRKLGNILSCVFFLILKAKQLQSN